MSFTVPFSQITLANLPQVGGKNASLGEMFQKLTPEGILVPDGFAITAKAYWHFLEQNGLRQPLDAILRTLDTAAFSNLKIVGEQARSLMMGAQLPEDVKTAIREAYACLRGRAGEAIQLAVRSSATAEDLPEASFAGQQESFLNIRGEAALYEACLNCYASLFTNRAIKYRIDNGFDHMQVALSIGVQQMVRSDKACAGVCFTLEPETGFRDVVVLSGAWGLGENVVKGNVDPDEFLLFKPALRNNKKSILSRKTGDKQKTMIYSENPGTEGATVNTDTSKKRRAQLILGDREVETLARWSLRIEAHYGVPMDIEWAKDGISGNLFIVQARPETIHTTKRGLNRQIFTLKETGRVLAKGSGVGSRITAGKVRLLSSPKEADKLQPGEVLVTDTTDPDWDPILKKAAGIVTNRGGRTSHAAIVARELGAVAVVGTGNATEVLQDGQEVTLSCAESREGRVYEGRLRWEETTRVLSDGEMPHTQAMLILADPGRAFQAATLPNNGVGLMRMEFVISNTIRIHPMALVRFDELKDKKARREIERLTKGYLHRTDYFVEQLSQAVATIAAAFYPKDVIVRMSDFKTNEYANLLGGSQFEPQEENPMIGFRGASRYDHDLYREGFRLECEAMKVVRNDMGLTNVKLMIPFCRTVEEGRKVVGLMSEYGLRQGDQGLEIYTMIEIPANVMLAKSFGEVFDGFSIGSNDLTQLTLGLDRDNALVSPIFDENNPAVKEMLAMVIRTAKANHIKIGLCGQAPSDFPEFAQFLVEQGIDSISFQPDALLAGLENIRKAEAQPV